MSNVLDEIVASKRQEVARTKSELPESELRRRVADAPPPRNFAAALNGRPEIRVIAEVKQASPSAGLLRANFDPVAIATIYAAHGASAISVLTDTPFFRGHLDHLALVRPAVPIPVLRKDFLYDSYQILQSRAAGADSVLLIAEVLPGRELTDRVAECRDLGMEPLVEFHDADNLDRVVQAGAKIIGINNRNLRSFVTDLAHTVDLLADIPNDRIVVSESGIATRADVIRLQQAGVHAILVGETLMRAPEIGPKLRELMGT